MSRAGIKSGVSVALTVIAIAVVLWQADLGDVASAAAALPPVIIGACFFALVAGALLASARIWLIARDIGHKLSARDAVAVLSLGQLAGTLFFQLAGQLIARSALLARRGLPVSVTLILTGYERAVALAVSLALAMAGGWLIFGQLALDMQGGGLELIDIASGLILAIMFGAAFGWGSSLARASSLRLTTGFAVRATRSVAISIAIQLCTMLAYVLAAKALAPEIELADLAAAAAVVMLAASLPISLAGWGVREVSAVLALGAIGMPAEKAVVVAVLVGILSLLSVCLLAAISSQALREAPSTSDTSQAARFGNLSAALVWLLGIWAATGVFFQLYVPTGRGLLNVNFADPVAIIGGVLFLVWALRDRQWPLWRLSWFNAHVLAATLAMGAALLIGWSAIGWTTWAFTNKFMGWFILLGYGATGALLIRQAGDVGFTVFLRTLAAVAAALTLTDLIPTALRFAGVEGMGSLAGLRIFGFSQNPNAFAFQLILALTAALVAFRRVTVSTALGGLLLAGLWFTGSRAGLGACAVAMVVLLVARPMLWQRLALSAAAAAAIVMLVISAGVFAPRAEGADPALYGFFIPDATTNSDAERADTIRGGIDLFLSAPVFGAGLGVFNEMQTRATGTPLIIHSTPLWLLAEFGVIGALIIIAPIVRVFASEAFQRRTRDDAAVILMVAIAAFGVMSLAHEMMYQRLFWLMLGAGLALLPTRAARP